MQTKWNYKTDWAMSTFCTIAMLNHPHMIVVNSVEKTTSWTTHECLHFSHLFGIEYLNTHNSCAGKNVMQTRYEWKKIRAWAKCSLNSSTIIMYKMKLDGIRCWKTKNEFNFLVWMKKWLNSLVMKIHYFIFFPLPLL